MNALFGPYKGGGFQQEWVIYIRMNISASVALRWMQKCINK
jgi:hypothetical protein